jgi:hypothetical protein
MINKNEAPFGFYAVEYDKRCLRYDCGCDCYHKYSSCYNTRFNCFKIDRKDGCSVIFKAKWWFKPIWVWFILFYRLRSE